ncbi:MAG: hypothetical protein HC871_11435 [Rhizobiales bacterium]|nr:hypothetical protein [Hyphomicrobiales bacterium]
MLEQSDEAIDRAVEAIGIDQLENVGTLDLIGIGTIESASDRVLGLASAQRQALGQHLARRRDQNHPYRRPGAAGRGR